MFDRYVISKQILVNFTKILKYEHGFFNYRVRTFDVGLGRSGALCPRAVCSVASCYHVLPPLPQGRSSCFGKKMDTWSCARLADWLMTHEGMMKACGHDLALVASDPSESTSSYKKERDSIAKLALASMYICRARISCSSTNAQGLAHVGIKGNMHSRGI